MPTSRFPSAPCCVQGLALLKDNLHAEYVVLDGDEEVMVRPADTARCAGLRRAALRCGQACCARHAAAMP